MGRGSSKGDVIASIVFLSIGIGVIGESFRLRIGSATEPQPGFFPLLGGVFLIFLAGILMTQALRGRTTGTKPFKFWGPPAIMVGVLCLYVAVFNTVGYVLATIPLGMVVLYIMDTKQWRILLLTSFILSLASYILFSKFLDVPISNGILARFF